MCVIRRHGLVFALIGEPDGAMWSEVRRERDHAVIVSGPFDGSPEEYAEGVDDWIDDWVTERVNEWPVDTCNACGGQRHQPEPESDDEPLTGTALIEYRFDLCPPCTSHLIATNPWILRRFGVDAYQD